MKALNKQQTNKKSHSLCNQDILTLEMIDQLSPVSIASLSRLLNSPRSTLAGNIACLVHNGAVESIGWLNCRNNNILKGRYLKCSKSKFSKKILGRMPKLPYGKSESLKIRLGERLGFRIGKDVYVGFHRLAIQYFLSIVVREIYQILKIDRFSIRCYTEQYLKNQLGWWGSDLRLPKGNHDNVKLQAIPDAVIKTNAYKVPYLEYPEIFFEIELTVRSKNYYYNKFRFLKPRSRPIIFVVPTARDVEKLGNCIPSDINFYAFSFDTINDMLTLGKFASWIKSL